MKKLIVALCALVVLGGCASGSKEVKTASCTSKIDQNGIVLDMKIDFDYEGEKIVKQVQKGVISTEDDSIYQQMKAMMEAQGYADKSKDMDGVAYELKNDDAKKTITENLSIDLTKISGKDYKILTNGEAETGDGKFIMDLNKTIDGFKDQGYTCAL